MGDTMREAFETAMAAEGYETRPLLYRDGTYRSPAYVAGWAMWQRAHEAGRQLGMEQAEQRAERLRIERDVAQARLERSVKILAAIYGLLYPPPVKSADGRHLVFRPAGQSANRYMQELSDRIRAIPDELAAHGIPTPPAGDSDKPRHVCGAQGFGALGDVCPGCGSDTQS